jgi:hypothetical protein
VTGAPFPRNQRVKKINYADCKAYSYKQNSKLSNADRKVIEQLERNFGWGHTTNLGQGSSKMFDVICICKMIN